MRKFLQKIFKTENINLTEVQEKIDKCNLNKNQLILSSCGSGKTLKTTICMLDELVKRGNKFVIMTATMPEVLINFLKDRYDMEVTITDKPSVENRCVKLKYIKSINFDKIESFQNKQIIICNSHTFLSYIL